MDKLIRFCIEQPVSVLVGVMLVALFGYVSLSRMSYQLAPTVVEPEITVTTVWPGATPYEIERDIIEEQEDVLKGIPGLLELESEAFQGQGQVTLRFRLGTDVDAALLRVSNRLDEVPEYPENVERPVINATGSATSPVVWLVMKSLPGNDRHIRTYRTFFEDEVRQHLERIPNMADLFVFGGTETEMHVIVDPVRLASYRLTVTDLIRALRSENTNISAGDLGVGRRSYRIRVVGEFSSPGEIATMVVRSSGQERVLVSDVARVEYGFEEPTAAMLNNGVPGIAVGVRPEPGANVIELTDMVEAAVRELNQGLLKENGVFLDWSYDQRPYILGAIELVQEDILVGAVMAMIVLLVFLRSLASTFVIAFSIPVSIVGMFIFLYLLGRSLNVVSLAGVSFAVGMLVDNSIVMLENIERHRALGKGPFEASYDGAREVFGAIVAGTLTNVAVFLPVVFVQEEAGQLFKDIAIAISVSNILSMLVAASVIPMLTNKVYGWQERHRIRSSLARRVSGLLTSVGVAAASLIMFLTGQSMRNVLTRLATIFSLVGVAALITWAFFPKMEYLPQGNRNQILSILIPPPGLSYEERLDVGQYIMSRAEPHLDTSVDGLPGIRNIFYIGAPQIMLFGTVSDSETRASELLPLTRDIVSSIPGFYGISLQAGIFETRLGRGRTINVDVSGPDIERIVMAGGALVGAITQVEPGSQIRPVPSLELTYPEVRLIPKRDRIRAAGLSVEDAGVAVDVIMDGRIIGDYNEEGRKTIDLVVTGSEEEISTPEALYRALVATPSGEAVPVSSLMDLVRTTGMPQIRHYERQRTVTLEVTPPTDTPLQAALEAIEGRAIPGVRQTGLLEGIEVTLSGAADKLLQARQALAGNLILAVVITYLLMAALYENFLYPVIVLFVTPLASAGGFLGLWLQNTFLRQQALDIVTMLGFIMLVGVVANNAVLIIHQALENVRLYGMEHRQAVMESVRTRIRPIYMSALVSAFGMLPLAITPGPGSELYAGLGSVVLTGQVVSTVFTVFVVPALLIFFIRMEKRENKSKPSLLEKTLDKPVDER